MFNEKEREFLIGLEQLTRKTGIAIGGCGCCGSPFLLEAEITSDKSGYGRRTKSDATSDADYIGWIDPTDYDWEDYSQNIIKTKEA